MNTILTIYGQTAFKRFLLPAVNDTNYDLLLSKDLYDLSENISLKLEVVDHAWGFIESDDYDLVIAGGSPVFASESTRTFGSLLRDGSYVLWLQIEGRHIASIIIRNSDNSFAAYDYYRLPNGDGEITIGRSGSSDICMDSKGGNLLSSHHAVLVYKSGHWFVRDEGSKNGTFLNNRRVESEAPLTFGDCIDLFGLRLVYLSNLIAINQVESSARVRETKLVHSRPAPMVLSSENRRDLMKLFHRSPRMLARLDSSAVKIDDAPAPKDDIRRTSIMGAIGQGFAMTLPMLLGCTLMLYASRVQGYGQSAFMYVGLVTSVTSAVMGVVRTLSAMKKAQQDYEAYEILRHDKYGRYLVHCEQEIAERMTHNTEVLRARHLPTKVVSRYTAADAALWGKNVSQPDFLLHRIGTGDIPSPVEVEIPTHRFSLQENDLALRPDEIRAKYSKLKDVPICVDLREHRLVGIVGGEHNDGGVSVARTLISQIAATNSYTEVKIVVVYDEEQSGTVDLWSYVRWLPHVWNDARTLRYVASNAQEASDVFFELNRIVRSRIADSGGTHDEKTIPLPYYVLVLVSPHLLEGELLAPFALNSQNAYGLTTLYLAERYEDLPNECQFVIQNDDSFKGTFLVTDNLDERVPVCFDSISLTEAEAQAASLATVRVHELQSGGDVPDTVSFFEMYGIHRPDQLDVLGNWRKNRTYESMRALIGQKAGGAPCYLDIHEKYHGPHGLVAGTTGSGKSETLQTFILSLAINFSPDDVSFFIIDYKGGGMAGLLTGLPHLSGQISNLSGNQVQRALVSIQSEKNRREAIFAEYGVKDIRDYTRLVKSGEAPLPVPHLIIVIDEFAEMKQDEPEFIQEVVSLARVGRSLGIHLIMATQRPAGAVSEDIWANSRFKLCLRVQSRQDSMDMLHRPDAAYLTQSGRCFLQVGNDELFELFQSGYSGAPYAEDGMDDVGDIATMLGVNGIPALVGSHARIQRQRQHKRAWAETLLASVSDSGVSKPSQLDGLTHEQLEQQAHGLYSYLAARGVDYPESEFNTEALTELLAQIAKIGLDVDALLTADEMAIGKFRLPQRPERSQLEAVVNHLEKVAHSYGYDRDYSLFLPLLPSMLSMADLTDGVRLPDTSASGSYRWSNGSGRTSLAVGIGLYDDPLNQRQDTFVYDPLRDGNLSVYGGPQNGKSTFLQTLTGALLSIYDPSRLSLYVVEYSARKFSAMECAPHVGGIVRDNDGVDRLDKLFTMLSRQLNERKQVLGDVSYLQYLEIHGMGSLPATILVIDNYASLMQRTEDRYGNFLRNLTKEGQGYGIYVAIGAGGISGGEVPPRLAENFRTVVCLELSNSYDYAGYLRRNSLRIKPETGTPGRGLVAIGDRVLEFQTATLFADENELETSEHLRLLADGMAKSWKGKRATTIPFIPEKPTWEEFVSLETTQSLLTDDRTLPLGYDLHLAEPYGIDLASTYVWCLTGAKKKGKTNALRALALSAKAKGGRVVMVDYGHGSKHFAEEHGIECIDDEQQFEEFIVALMPQVVERNGLRIKLNSEGVSDEDVYLRMLQYERVFILIEDLPKFVERAYKPSMELENRFDEFLTSMLERCALHNIYWFVTIDRSALGTATTQDMFSQFIRDHKGAHFGGRTYTTAINGFSFDNHNRRTVDNPRMVGHAMLPAEDDTEVLEVVVPRV